MRLIPMVKFRRSRIIDVMDRPLVSWRNLLLRFELALQGKTLNRCKLIELLRVANTLTTQKKIALARLRYVKTRSIEIPGKGLVIELGHLYLKDQDLRLPSTAFRSSAKMMFVILRSLSRY